MPELPEVETTRRGIAPHLVGQTITGIAIHQRQLRWPISADLEAGLTGQKVTAVKRRAKYLLLTTGHGTALMHLGMSGSLRIVSNNLPLKKHDHVDMQLSNGQCLRYHDPRRFGALLWLTEAPEQHELLRHLGPEPLSDEFDAEYLHARAQGRRTPVKTFIMDGRIVVGVGNIYASEALFMAGIRPTRAAGKISLKRYAKLVETIKQVLSEAITQGGTTLRDFVNSDGEPGYFRQYLRVYERKGESCRECSAEIRAIRLGQRSTYYCPKCQR